MFVFFPIPLTEYFRIFSFFTRPVHDDTENKYDRRLTQRLLYEYNE